MANILKEYEQIREFFTSAALVSIIDVLCVDIRCFYLVLGRSDDCSHWWNCRAVFGHGLHATQNEEDLRASLETLIISTRCLLRHCQVLRQ